MYSTLFTIFGIPIRSYGLMLAIAFVAGMFAALKRAEAKKIPQDYIYDISGICLISGVLGSRALYIALNPTTERWSDFFKVWQGGLSFHGGLILALLCGLVYCRAKKLRFLEMCDLFMPSLALGYAIARIGCFLNGCCAGGPTNLPWGVRFDGETSCHPTQIYAAVANVIIFFILTRLEKKPSKPGFLLCSYVAMYALYRFLVEFLREGYSAEMWRFGLTQAQGFSVLMFLVGLFFALKLRKSP